MAKITHYNFAYLKVEVDRPSRYAGEIKREKWLFAARELKTAIERHCDGFATIDIEHDVDELCEFCGSTWTERGDSPHNGGCCDADEAVMRSEDQAKAQKETA